VSIIVLSRRERAADRAAVGVKVPLARRRSGQELCEATLPRDRAAVVVKVHARRSEVSRTP